MRCWILFSLCVHFCDIGVDSAALGVTNEQGTSKKTHVKFSIEELLVTVFPKKTSGDEDLDPCKAGRYMGDIALTSTDLIAGYATTPTQNELSPKKYKKESAAGEHLISIHFPQREAHKRHGLLKYKNENGNHKRAENNIFKNELVKINKEQKEDFLSASNIKESSQYAQKGPFQQSIQTPEVGHIAKNNLKVKHRVTRAATAKSERIWDNGIIPYEFDDIYNMMQRALFKQAMRHWENNTCVKFVERIPDEHHSYIIFTEKPCGCCSFVGKKGKGPQEISIGKGCDKFGVVVHELGHVVGFWHEHTRPDRDKYVDIIKANILLGQDHNFNKLSDTDVNSLGFSYDYGSIMHYERNALSKGRYLDTIQPKVPPGMKRPEIGQRFRLSEGDIAQTNMLYKCPACGRTLQGNSGTFSSPSHLENQTPKETVLCEWRITATYGERIELNITQLDIRKSPDCSTDYVEVRDGYWYKSPLLGTYCGTKEVRNITSTGSRMLVRYIAANPAGYKGFTATYEAKCGGDIHLDSFTSIESPNHPENYESNKECVWKISVPNEHQIAVKFDFFELETHDACVYDYLEVRDGFSSNLSRFCGSHLPKDFISTSNVLMIKFVSDGNIQRGGFSARIMKEYDECSAIHHGCEHHCINTLGGYKCGCQIGYELHSDGKRCEDACGGVLEELNGTITSPSFPDLYPSNKNCVWEIRTPPNFKITINITHLDIEGSTLDYILHQPCDYDGIEILSKIGENNYTSHGVYCGVKRPDLFISSSNIVRVIFKSDANIQKSGFAAIYFSYLDQCSINNGGCEHECVPTPGSFKCVCRNGFKLDENCKSCKDSGCIYEITSPVGTIQSPNYPANYPKNRDCVWYFKTLPGHRIRLAFIEFDVEYNPLCANDHVDCHDGPSKDSMYLGTFCGPNLPRLIVTSREELYVNFKSDSSVQGKGFLATYTTVCGGILQATREEQYIYSHPTFGNDTYKNNTQCDWSIEAIDWYEVKISFVTFELELGENCQYDYVEVFNDIEAGPHTHGKFCGKKAPPDITSTEGSLFIRFDTDETVAEKGFKMIYQAVEI